MDVCKYGVNVGEGYEWPQKKQKPKKYERAKVQKN
jgi:hypothetical protein